MSVQSGFDHAISMRVGSKSVDMVNKFRQVSGASKTDMDRMAHTMGLELMDEILRSGGEADFMINVARRIETLVKMRHYDEVVASQKAGQ